MSIVQRRILEQLGAAGLLLVSGCREPEVASPEPPATVEGGTPVATGAVVATGEVDATGSEAGATASSTGAGAAPHGRGDVGATCKTASDCKTGLSCKADFDGKDFAETGLCTAMPLPSRGRPLLVDGTPRFAELDSKALEGVAHPQASDWASAAAEEHASVAAFARTICQLMALGAPLGLLERSQAALSDELEHTRGSLAWLARTLGREVALGALPEAIAPLASRRSADPLELAHELLVDVLRGGCVGEALAAEAMLARAGEARDPELAAWLRGVADDEARHAALAFETALWLVQRWPALAVVVAEECERLDGDARRLVMPIFEAAGLTRGAAACARTARTGVRSKRSPRHRAPS